jgi:hypothetical protein
LIRTIAIQGGGKDEYSVLVTRFDNETNKVPPEDYKAYVANVI